MGSDEGLWSEVKGDVQSSKAKSTGIRSQDPGARVYGLKFRKPRGSEARVQRQVKGWARHSHCRLAHQSDPTAK
jgi:hypothetical protein